MNSFYCRSLRDLGRIILVLALGARGLVAAPTPPNVVVILADDLGYGSVGCYGAPPLLVSTPHIDRLASEGRRFTDACTPASVCSPTRYALLTGRYAWRTSLKAGAVRPNAPILFEAGRPTLASMLKGRGYATAAIGKWHLGFGDQNPIDLKSPLKPGPQERGFDYFYGVPHYHGDRWGVYIENHEIVGLRSSDVVEHGINYYGEKFFPLDAPQRKDPEVMSVLASHACDWLAQQSRQRPFFLYFAAIAVHEPITPSPQSAGTSKAGPYGDFIHDLDRAVGRILESIERLGVAENTLVIFTSDNGGVLPSTRGEVKQKPPPPFRALNDDLRTAAAAGLSVNGPLRGGKHSALQGGFRVPFIVRWPACVPARSVSSASINLVDVYATIAAAAGAEAPRDGAVAEDSWNVLPAWTSKDANTPARTEMILHSSRGTFAMIEGPWKWIEGKPYSKDGGDNARDLGQADNWPQLYNLQADSAETNDVTVAHPDISARLAARLNQLRDAGHSRPRSPL